MESLDGCSTLARCGMNGCLKGSLEVVIKRLCAVNACWLKRTYVLGGHGGTLLEVICCVFFCCWVCLASLRCLVGGVENDEGVLTLYSSDSELRNLLEDEANWLNIFEISSKG